MKEEWKPVVGYESAYEVSNIGRIRSVSRTIVRTDGLTRRVIGKVLTPQDVRGYQVVLFVLPGRRRFGMSIHRAVAMAFIGLPPSPKHEINHKNSVRGDNRVENLEWVTRSQNIVHSLTRGTRRGLAGEAHPRSRLTAKDVVEIRRLARGGVSGYRLASRFGVSQQHVTKIVSGQAWSCLEEIK